MRLFMIPVASGLLLGTSLLGACASDVADVPPASDDVAGAPSARADEKVDADADGALAQNEKPTTPKAPKAPTTTNGSRPRCVKKPSQVMIVGDSYINWISHTFPADLDNESGQKGWRLEAIGAASMGSGGATTRIPKQFDLSYERDPDVHTVIMDGGGNDVLVPSPYIDLFAECKNDEKSPTLPQCQKIVETALEAGSKLMDRAAAVGVRDVVFFFYPRVPEGTLIGGDHPNAINEYAEPKVRALCEGAAERTGGKLRCYYVDMVKVFEGQTGWFVDGDIHPNPTGSAGMAKAVWSLMKDKCLGQLESSGCCEP